MAKTFDRVPAAACKVSRLHAPSLPANHLSHCKVRFGRKLAKKTSHRIVGRLGEEKSLGISSFYLPENTLPTVNANGRNVQATTILRNFISFSTGDFTTGSLDAFNTIWL